MVAADILRHPEDWNGQLKRDDIVRIFQFPDFTPGMYVLYQDRTVKNEPVAR
jgi:hypothetical protein